MREISSEKIIDAKSLQVKEAKEIITASVAIWMGTIGMFMGAGLVFGQHAQQEPYHPVAKTYVKCATPKCRIK